METNLWTGDFYLIGSLRDHEGVDDKGHITARLTALRKYIRESGDLPVNITFIIEGGRGAWHD